MTIFATSLGGQPDHPTAHEIALNYHIYKTDLRHTAGIVLLLSAAHEREPG
jgi:hypothetical protein